MIENFNEENQPIEETPIEETVEVTPVEETYIEETPVETVPEIKQTVPMPKPIVCDTAKEIKDEKSVTGFKVFISIVGVIMAICILLTAGFIAGRELNFNASSPEGVVKKPSGEDAMTAGEVYENCKDSVVAVIAYDTSGNATNGSGVVYSSDGYIITNDHIYADIPNAKFYIITADGTSYDAKFVAGDARNDIGILKADASGLKAATFADSNEILPGESAIAIGYPDGPFDGQILSEGVISSKKVRAANSRTNYSMPLIQTDAAINHGSSGGALFDAYGHVIGITCSKLTGEDVDRVGFAIHSNTVVKTVQLLTDYGYVKGRAKLGISYTENSIVDEKYNSEMKTGLVIGAINEQESVFVGTDVQVGDIITGVNDEKITSANFFLDILETKEAGEQMILTVYSPTNKTSKTYTVTLIEDKGGSSYVLNVDDSTTASN